MILAARVIFGRISEYGRDPIGGAPRGVEAGGDAEETGAFVRKRDAADRHGDLPGAQKCTWKVECPSLCVVGHAGAFMGAVRGLTE